MRLSLADYLGGQGIRVNTARDTGKALQLLAERKMDIIILDINLAGENGLELMRYLNKNYSGIPIIIYTGLRHEEHEIKSMLEQGASLYLTKNQPPEDLLSAIRQTYAQKYGHA